jgi:SAM-dependent methyltransferase
MEPKAMQPWVDLQYTLLKHAYPQSPDLLSEQSYAGKSKLTLLGDELTSKLQGKTVIDFGCGKGNEAIEIAQRGAAHVIGLDIREDFLAIAEQKATLAGVADRCTFATATREQADVITSIDAFEHFSDPAAILRIMHNLLVPGGEVLFSFGPTWLHPLGGHLFSVFPWAHVVLSEQALVKWRSDFKTDGATCFADVAGGLNQMMISRFEHLVTEAGFQLDCLDCVPINKLKPLHNRLTREFTTALCRGRLRKL